MLTPVDAEGSDASRIVEVKLPEKTGTDAVTYYFRYSLDGTTLAGELPATVPGTGGGTPVSYTHLHNTMEGVWRLIPEDLKPYTAIQLHADDYLGHAWGGIGNKENLQKFMAYLQSERQTSRIMGLTVWELLL